MADLAVGAYGEDKLAGAVYILFLQRSTVNPVMVSRFYLWSNIRTPNRLPPLRRLPVEYIWLGSPEVAPDFLVMPLTPNVSSCQGYWKLRSRSDGFPFSLMPGNAFGVAISSIADMNGDGVPEMVVGAYM